jgi:hypothetical protein
MDNQAFIHRLQAALPANTGVREGLHWWWIGTVRIVKNETLTEAG